MRITPETLNQWRVFPRLLAAVFVYVFVDCYQWTKAAIMSGLLQGDWIGPVFIGAIVTGFVAMVQNYQKSGGSNGP